MKIKVTRAFLHKGERQEAGTVIEVKDNLGAELVYNGRAERISAAPAPGPMTTQSTPELVDGAVPKQAQVNKKGHKHD